MAQTTKKLLAKSLAELLETKPLGKITINEITDNCGISRMTFYYHFKDIYELVDWMIISHSVMNLASKVYGGDWEAGIRQSLENGIKYKKIILNIYGSIDRRNIENYVSHIYRKLICEKIDELSEGMDIDEKDKAFVANFYIKALSGLVIEWIDGGMKRESEEEWNRLKRMFDGILEFSLENLRKKQT